MKEKRGGDVENLSLVACVSRRGVGFDLGLVGRCLSLLMLCFVSAPAVAGEAAGAASKPSCPMGRCHLNSGL